jgi:hypothetical protein
MDAAATAKVDFTSDDGVRDVIRDLSADGFGSLYPTGLRGAAGESPGSGDDHSPARWQP